MVKSPSLTRKLPLILFILNFLEVSGICHVVEDLIKQVEILKVKNTKIDNQAITDILTINGVLNDVFDCSRSGTRCVYGYWTKGN